MTEFNNIRALIIDMDGVLWHGNRPTPGLHDFFKTLRALKLPFVLATNNASLTQQQYIDKLANMGVNIHAKEIITSSMATASYLANSAPMDKRRVFIIGEEGLRLPLIQHGFTLTDRYEGKQKGDKDADIVVSGLDRKLTWDKLAAATLHINAGAQFFATNQDNTLPSEQGEVIGNGGIVAALEAATGVKATCIGKPEPILYEKALSILKTESASTIAIGDRLDTDILGAINAGMRSLLLLTGVSTKEDIKNVDYQPTWVMANLNEIKDKLIVSQTR